MFSTATKSHWQTQLLQKLTHAPTGSYCPHTVTPESPRFETSLLLLHLEILTDCVDTLPFAEFPGQTQMG